MVALEKKVDGTRILRRLRMVFIDETWIIWMQKIIQGEYWNWLRNCYENFYEKIYEKKKKNSSITIGSIECTFNIIPITSCPSFCQRRRGY